MSGQIVGGAEYFQRIRTYHPLRFQLSLSVLPPHRRQGIGDALYGRLMAALAEHDPVSIGVRTREDWLDATGFAERRGFQAELKMWEAHLNVQSLDLAPWLPKVERVLAAGYQILDLPALQRLPNWAERLYALVNEVRTRRASPTDRSGQRATSSPSTATR